MESAADIVLQIAKGTRSAAAVLAECKTLIQARDPDLNCFTAKTFERAEREAAAIDALYAEGKALPPLAGVPYAVKNLFDVEGLVTLAGAKINAGNAPAAADAKIVARMSRAGAVLVGALNMEELAYGFLTENHHYGITRNPRDPSRGAGGSSGGSAAAVGAGMLPITLGSDTSGSIRVPASLCGVFGLKPTYGRLPRSGTYPFVNSLDHVGPFANSVLGLALAYDAMQGPDPADPACAQRHPVHQGAAGGVGETESDGVLIDIGGLRGLQRRFSESVFQVVEPPAHQGEGGGAACPADELAQVGADAIACDEVGGEWIFG